jgi:hypothetical protein
MKDNHEQHNLETEKAIIDNIEKFGCHLALIEDDNYLPGFVYSIGLFKNYNHPEIICFGLKSNVMGTIINHVCDLIKKGENFAVGKLYAEFLEGYNVQFIKVNEEYYPNYLGYATWFYDKSFDFPVLQLVWPDMQNNFPWDKDFNPDFTRRQPLLDRNTDFKFYEKRNLGVYTTKQIFQGEPILYVYHNENGDWQFHASDNPKIEDAILVCLEEIIKLDPSVNNIYHLQYGWSASRKSPEEDWEYAEDPDAG